MSGFDGTLLPSETFGDNDDDSIIKKSLLIFDKIHAIIPNSFDLTLKESVRRYKLKYAPEKLYPGCDLIARPDQGRDPSIIQRHDRIVSFLKKTETLRNSGILKVLNPDENIKSQPYYWDSGSPAQYQWATIKKKFDDFSRNFTFNDIENYSPHLLYGNILSDLQDEQFRKIVYDNFSYKNVLMYKGQAEANWILLIGNESGFSEDIAEPVNGGPFGMKISSPFWASLILNHALISSFRHSTTPVCTKGVFQKLLNRKLERCYSIFRGLEDSTPHFKGDLKTQLLILEILPDLELSSFDDVLEIRARLKDEMIDFREKMKEISNVIKSNSYSDNFPKHIELLIRDKVNPSIINYKRKLHQLNLRAINSTVLATGLSIGLLIQPILNPAFAMITGASLPQTLQTYRKERNEVEEQNGLSFLLKINKK